MSLQSEILAKLKALNPKTVPCLPATVKSVEGFTCTVILPDGLELAGVRLRAAIDKSEEYFTFKPRLKSTVLIAQIGDEDTAGEYYVASFSEVDAVNLLIGKTEIGADKNAVNVVIENSYLMMKKDEVKVLVGTNSSHSKITVTPTAVSIEPKNFLTIKNQTTDLKNVIQDLISAIQNISIVTPTGVGTLNPAQIPSVQAILVKLNQLM